jgi:hypothetical protein
MSENHAKNLWFYFASFFCKEQPIRAAAAWERLQLVHISKIITIKLARGLHGSSKWLRALLSSGSVSS